MYLRVLGQGGGTDALQFPRLKDGLMMLDASIAPSAASGTDDGVQLVDEKDDIPGPADLVHDGFDPLLELAAILGPGHHEGKVEGDDFFAAEDLRDVPGNDFLGQALSDGGFSDSSFSDEHRIVFRPAAKDLDNPLNFGSSSDHRIEFPVLGEFG